MDLRSLVTGYNPAGECAVKIVCVNTAHSDPTASMAVYADHLHCFGCGFHRNDIDECVALLTGKELSEARLLIAQNPTIFVAPSRDAAPDLSPMCPALANIYHRCLTKGKRQHRLEWLYARGLTDESIRAANLGHTGEAFSIPVYDAAGSLVTIRYRRDDEYGDEGPKYFGTKGRNGFYLYGGLGGPTSHDSKELVICEGELDVLRLWQTGTPACSATNGAGNAHRVPEALVRMFPHRLPALYIATDQDDAGNQAATKTIQEAKRLGFECYRCEWWSGKDVTESYLNREGFEDWIKKKL